MPGKPPTGGGPPAKVNTTTSPTRAANVETPLASPLGRRGSGSGIYPDSQPQAGSSGATNVGIIRPAVDRVLDSASVEVPQPDAQLSFVDYLVSLESVLPEVNSEGLRVNRKVTYAELAAGKFVPVRVDPKTGLYRARRPSESQLGPVMLRDADSGLWYPREVIEPTTRAQVQRYLPETTDLDADAFIARFGDKDVADVELKRIERGLADMELDIDFLMQTVYHDSPDAGVVMASKLRRLYKWQGEPNERVYHAEQPVGFKMDIDLDFWPVAFPNSTKFNSVVALTLRAGDQRIPKSVLAQFPNIESLAAVSQWLTSPRPGDQFRFPGGRPRTFSRFKIDQDFVEQLTRLPHLRELNLQDGNLPAGFSLTGMTELRALSLRNVQGVTDLTGMVNVMPGRLGLQVLDLHQNAFLKVAPDVTGMTELRVLDLTQTGINQLPLGLDADNGPLRLEVLKLGDNPLAVMPSLKGRTALQELDLSNTGLDKFPEGITSEIPGKVLNLSNNRITSIPESVEIRAGFNLIGNPITDLPTLRRLMNARIKTGTDIWLGEGGTDSSPNAWLRHLPLEDLPENLNLWNSVDEPWLEVRKIVWQLSRTPEFHVERTLLQQRVWRFFESYSKAEPGARARLKDIVKGELSPMKKLERLEAETGLSSESLPPDSLLRSDTGSGGGRLLNAAEPTTQAQFREYFPKATDQQADHFSVHFGDNKAAEVELKRLQLGLARLDHEVSLWKDVYDASRNALGLKLRRLYTWQGEPDELVFHDRRPVGFKLSLHLQEWPDLQPPPTTFNSIVSLDLGGLGLTLPEGFFTIFPNLESLNVAYRYGIDPANRRLRLTMESGSLEELARLARLRELKLRKSNLPPDFSVAGMTGLRVLDLEQTGIHHLSGLNADNGPLRLEVLKLGDNPLSVVPSVKGMTALQELDLSNTGLDRFPEGITSEIPAKVLNLANNRIASIPESCEIRAGLNLMGNPITDRASFRRLIEARKKTGTDFWLGPVSNDRSENLWLQSVHEDVGKKRKLWNTVGELDPDVRIRIRSLSATPEFHAERPLLERRVWWFLRDYSDADISGRVRLNDILLNERSPGKMLDRLEADIRENDPKRQNPPQHHLPKRPRLD
jgi:Leucine-rich repeat (LRR) protein